MKYLTFLSVLMFSTVALSQDFLGDLEQRFSFELSDTQTDVYAGPLDYNRPYQAAGPLQNMGVLSAASPLQATGPIDVGRLVVPGSPDMPVYSTIPYVPVAQMPAVTYVSSSETYQPSNYVMFDPNVSTTPVTQNTIQQNTSGLTPRYSYAIPTVLPPTVYNPTPQRTISPN